MNPEDEPWPASGSPCRCAYSWCPGYHPNRAPGPPALGGEPAQPAGQSPSPAPLQTEQELVGATLADSCLRRARLRRDAYLEFLEALEAWQGARGTLDRIARYQFKCSMELAFRRAQALLEELRNL